MEKMIGDDCIREISILPGYGDFFAGIMTIAGGKDPDERTGKTLRLYVQNFLKTCDLGRFRKSPDEPYSRFYLGRDDATGWEAIMMCWDISSVTTIHGHPEFASYNFADGRFRVELFDFDIVNGLRPKGSIEPVAGDGFFAVGRPGAFDNHIHRITCLSDTGHSLHVYCGDARKGVVFAEKK